MSLLLRVDGRSKADRAIRATVVYCYIMERGFGQRDVDSEELRRLCKEQKAFDPANFARTLRESSWLFVVGEPRRKKWKCRLSVEGEEQAKNILQELLDG